MQSTGTQENTTSYFGSRALLETWCTPTLNLDPLNIIVNNVINGNSNNNTNNSKKPAKTSSYTPLTGLILGTVSSDSSA